MPPQVDIDIDSDVAMDSNVDMACPEFHKIPSTTEVAHHQNTHDQITRHQTTSSAAIVPVELLEEILSHLGGQNFFRVARVDKLFKAVTDGKLLQRKMYLLETETHSVEELNEHFERVTQVTYTNIPSAIPAFRRIRGVVASPLRPPSSERGPWVYDFQDEVDSEALREYCPYLIPSAARGSQRIQEQADSSECFLALQPFDLLSAALEGSTVRLAFLFSHPRYPDLTNLDMGMIRRGWLYPYYSGGTWTKLPMFTAAVEVQVDVAVSFVEGDFTVASREFGVEEAKLGNLMGFLCDTYKAVAWF